MDKPKKWTEIYPYGTKEGDEESKVFRALARHPKFDWRSTPAIVKDTGLSRERVEEIIDKYVNRVKPALIYPHPTNDDHWGYWQRCPEVLDVDDRRVSTKDKDTRIDKHMGGSPSMVSNNVNPIVNCDLLTSMPPHGKLFTFELKTTETVAPYEPMKSEPKVELRWTPTISFGANGEMTLEDDLRPEYNLKELVPTKRDLLKRYAPKPDPEADRILNDLLPNDMKPKKRLKAQMQAASAITKNPPYVYSDTTELDAKKRQILAENPQILGHAVE